MDTFCRRPAGATMMVGLMSGTSLDGVDCVLADFTAERAATGLGPVLRHHAIPMPDQLRARILSLNTPSASSGGEVHLCALASNDLADLYARCVSELLSLAAVTNDQVIAVANHGQTIRHRPEMGYTTQIGNHALLAERLGLPVVADFRSRDVAAGGTGAPLVPAFHAAFFGDIAADETRADSSLPAPLLILNLGGIANVTALCGDSVVGFDTGPANVLSDLWIKECRDLDYDAGGAWASTGVIVPSLLARFLCEEFFSRSPPKSTGRDLFHREWLMAHVQEEEKSGQTLKPEDVAATILQLTAVSVAQAIERFCVPAAADVAAASSASTAASSTAAVASPHPLAPLYVCGGGALNTFLLSRLRFHLPGRVVESTAARGVDPLSVEATAFAWLGWQFLHGRPANLPRVTGAKGPRILGAYYPA